MRLRWLAIVLMGVGLLTACAQVEPTPTPTPTLVPTLTPTPIPTPTPTPTPVPRPVAFASMDVSSGTAPVNVRFSDSSQGSVTSWQWDFGDGASSTAQNPSHEYTVAGSYTVQLTVSGPGGSHTVALPEPMTITPGPLADVGVSPGPVSLQVQETARFVATGLDQFGNEISDVTLTWTGLGPQGSIDETGRFTAGTEAGTYDRLVKVTATEDGSGRSALIGVTITPGLLSSAAVEPAEVTLDIGATQSFSFMAFDEFGNEITDVLSSWSLVPDVGALDDKRVFTAGTKSGAFENAVTIEAVQGTARVTASATVLIQPDPLAEIVVDPSLPIVPKGTELQLQAVGLDQYGNPIPDLQFIWDSPSGLAVSNVGTVAGGEQEGLHSVTAAASFRGAAKTVSIDVAVPPVWVALPNMIERRDNHTATLLPDGRVLLIGGRARSVEVYDPESRTFAVVGELRGRSGRHTATLLQDGRVLVVDCSATGAELFDPATGLSAPTAGPSGPRRTGHAATLLSDGTVLVTGGRTGCTGEATATDSALIFNPDDASFTPVANPMIESRSSHGATLLSDGRVLLLGGLGGGPQGDPGCSDRTEIYDPLTGTFRAAGDLIFSRGCGSGDAHPAPILSSGDVVYIGVYGGGQVEIYDPVADVFSYGGLVSRRGAWTITLLPSGLILVAGGIDGRQTEVVGFAELYDPTSETVVGVSQMVQPRFEHAAILLPDGTVLVTGGRRLVEAGVTTSLRSAELFIPE